MKHAIGFLLGIFASALAIHTGAANVATDTLEALTTPQVANYRPDVTELRSCADAYGYRPGCE